MLGLQYTEKALKHWKQWRPKMVAEMLRLGTLDQEVQAASKEAARQVSELMQAGMQQFEAEEMVLRELIYLTPEPELA